MKIESLDQLREILINGDITPAQASKVLIKSLGLTDVVIGQPVTMSINEVIEKIDTLMNNEGDVFLINLNQVRNGRIEEFNFKHLTYGIPTW